MEFYQKNKKIFLFAGIFVGLFILYKIFFSGGSSVPASDPTAGGLVSQLSASPADAISSQDLLATLAKLQSITIDQSIFSDPVFISLKDKSHQLEQQPLGKSLGRRNPFSDFGGVTAIGTSTSRGIIPK